MRKAKQQPVEEVSIRHGYVAELKSDADTFDKPTDHRQRSNRLSSSADCQVNDGAWLERVIAPNQ